MMMVLVWLVLAIALGLLLTNVIAYVPLFGLMHLGVPTWLTIAIVGVTVAWLMGD